MASWSLRWVARTRDPSRAACGSIVSADSAAGWTWKWTSDPGENTAIRSPAAKWSRRWFGIIGGSGRT
jgi:hypothetical protein